MNRGTIAAALTSSVLTAALLILVTLKVKYPMLLGIRFFGDLGAIQIIVHAIYSFVLTSIFLTTSKRSRVRTAIWTLFSVVFFAQLAIGLMGFTSLLQTGELHYPVPALIIAGPLFRGEGVFMLTLLLTTILIVGPSWCSHLCYVGAIDNLLANKRKRAKKVSNRLKYSRVLILALTVITPLLLAKINNSLVVHGTVIFFIILSAFYFLLSRFKGLMVHCSYFCPIGLVTNVMGKINPFRIKIAPSCDGCGVCINRCKYGALNKKRLELGSPNINCTLCMDCTDVCHKSSISLKVFNKDRIATPLFYTLIVSLHSVFLAVARI